MSNTTSSSSSVRDLIRSRSAGENAVEPLDIMRRLINEVNALSGLSLEVSDQGVCELESIEGLPIAVKLHDQDRSLLLSALILRSEGDPAAGLMRELLEMNAYGADTQGGWLALIPDTGLVVFHFEWRRFQMSDGETLNELLNSFISHAHHLGNRLTEKS